MHIVVLTGAGISAESGVATFRDSGGLWEGHDVQEVATPQGFAANPELVHRFYDERRADIQRVEPNAAHLALARLEHEHPGRLTIVTQNVDDLHERAGSTNVIHMHGELLRAWCLVCDDRFGWTTTMADNPPCPGCGNLALRPDIVWFGEIPYRMDEIDQELRRAELFVAIGTSGEVYPAAGFVAAARAYGARTLELNLAVSRVAEQFDEAWQGPATEVVPAWVETIRSTSAGETELTRSD